MLKLIDTLRTVTAGKIYVENERARLTHRLSLIHEADDNVAEAAKIMQELQVETYGSMERKEKVELILEQMRLCLATKDYIRTQIISKKISTRFFEDAKYSELKLKFYSYMIELGQHEGDYLDICKNFRQVFDTPCIQEVRMGATLLLFCFNFNLAGRHQEGGGHEEHCPLHCPLQIRQ